MGAPRQEGDCTNLHSELCRVGENTTTEKIKSEFGGDAKCSVIGAPRWGVTCRINGEDHQIMLPSLRTTSPSQLRGREGAGGAHSPMDPKALCWMDLESANTGS